MKHHLKIGGGSCRNMPVCGITGNRMQLPVRAALLPQKREGDVYIDSGTAVITWVESVFKMFSKETYFETVEHGMVRIA